MGKKKEKEKVKTKIPEGEKIIIHTGSGWKIKWWKNEKWVELLKKINKPLVQTSVNISNKKSLSSMVDIKEGFGKNKNIKLMVNGGTLSKNRPSGIIDLTNDKIKILRK